MNSPVLYFGSLWRAGHFLFGPGERHIWAKDATPWGYELDGQLLQAAGVPDLPDKGVCAVTKKSGWTALSFWDRSVDQRGACSSSFLIQEDLSPEELWERAKVAWPQVVSRPGFPKLKIPNQPKSESKEHETEP